MIRFGVVFLWASIWGVASADSSVRYPYLSCFEIASRLHGVPLDVLLAVAATESNWDPDARSAANAHGIMQIQWPGTARHLGVKRVAELYNPCLNIELGARYLAQLMNDNGGDVERSLAAYNYGPTRIGATRQLPAGAKKYVASVNGHRDRINASAKRNNRWADTSRDYEVARFDSGDRARRYARSLGARLGTANLATHRMADGSYAVTMSVDAGGLSLADLSALERLGWSGAR